MESIEFETPSVNLFDTSYILKTNKNTICIDNKLSRRLTNENVQAIYMIDKSLFKYYYFRHHTTYFRHCHVSLTPPRP